MSPLNGWDAVWYHWVEAHGYDPAIAHGNLAAFYPGWPPAWHAVSWLPIPIYLAGSLLATALFGVALCLLYRITLGRYDVTIARRTVLFMAFWPLAFVFSMPYSESLFLLASLGAFALTWHGRWWSGSAVGALAVLARPVGIALFPALRLAHLPRPGLALAGVPAAAPDGGGRRRLLPVPRLAHRRLCSRACTPSSADGGGASCRCPIEIGRALWVDVLSNGLLRSLADVALHARLVRALVAGVVGAAAARRVPDLRRAARAPALERRLAALDGPDGDGRVPAVLGARGVERARSRGSTRSSRWPRPRCSPP